jgi:hypothetical protein
MLPIAFRRLTVLMDVSETCLREESRPKDSQMQMQMQMKMKGKRVGEGGAGQRDADER